MADNERIDRIEERLAWLERHVLEQDKAMLEIAEQNARLKRDLAAVQARLAAVAGAAAESSEPLDDRPPHY